jgi:hypothetical protein
VLTRLSSSGAPPSQLLLLMMIIIAIMQVLFVPFIFIFLLICPADALACKP